jgi:IMP dehydrogenase/GMP reductase
MYNSTNNGYALTYDDIQLIPSFSTIKSRQDINLKTLLSRRYGLLNPIVASPMDTVCGYDMALKMAELGGVGCIHRFMSIEDQCDIVERLYRRIYGDGFSVTIAEEWGVMYDDWHSEISLVPIMAAIGVSEDDKKRAKSLTECGANVILIDVAHGDHQNVIDMIKWCKENLNDKVDIIAGNIATAQAAERLIDAGADGLRVGIGGGCFTPNMEVRTSDGLKKIKDVEIGDEVYTHTGELKPVINKFEYGDFNEVYDIDGIEATANHKFYVVHQSKTDLVTDNNIHDYAEWVKAEDLTDEYFLIKLD